MPENAVQKSDPIAVEQFISLITKYTGIVPRAAHRKTIEDYIATQIAGRYGGSATRYRAALEQEQELSRLIEAATINETYFFREEAQFRFLEEEALPVWKAEHPGKELRVWSAACSTGEEAYSLALLARSLGVPVHVTASDIAPSTLEKCRAGAFTDKSLRTQDGAAYKKLLEPYRANGTIQFPKEITGLVEARRLNLVDVATGDTTGKAASLPQQDIILVRNVFVYFDFALRKAILEALSAQYLAPGGLLFVSMNEVATIGAEMTPPTLQKVHHERVFYFQKRT